MRQPAELVPRVWYNPQLKGVNFIVPGLIAIIMMTIAATLAGAITYLAHMAQWAAIFGGGRDRDEEGGGGFGLIYARNGAAAVEMAMAAYHSALRGARIQLPLKTRSHPLGAG